MKQQHKNTEIQKKLELHPKHKYKELHPNHKYNVHIIFVLYLE